MAGRAREGMKGLSLVQQTANAAATKLDSDVSSTRALIGTTTSLLDDLERELNAKHADAESWLRNLETDSVRIEGELVKAADTLRTADKNLNDTADAMSKSIKAKLATCTKEVSDASDFARLQLQKLVGYKNDLLKDLKALRSAAEDVTKSLNQAVSKVAAEHEALDKLIAAQLTALEQSYDGAIAATERRLAQLEGELKQLNSATDKHLNEVLVANLGAELRKAADAFGTDLTSLEKELEQVTRGLSLAHQGFQKNLNQHIQPEIDKISDGLYKAARNLGWV